MQRLAVVFGGGRRVRKGRLSLSSRRIWCKGQRGQAWQGGNWWRRGPACNGSHTQVLF